MKHYMKYPLVSALMLMACILNGQNLLQQYSTNLAPLGAPTAIHQGGGAFTYVGEFQIWMDVNHPWFYFRQSTDVDIFYRVEPVSFPMAPESITGPLGVRNMKSISEYDVNTQQWKWTLGSNSLNVEGRYEAEIITNSYYFINEKSNLISDMVDNQIWAIQNDRIYYPHTVLRVTLEMRCASSGNVLDELTYILDLTRGRMKDYPFNTQSSESLEAQHDVIPVLKGEQPSSWAETSNQSEAWNTMPHSTPNYYPLTGSPSACNIDRYPDPPTGSFFTSYASFAPYAIAHYEMYDFDGQNYAGYKPNFNGTQMLIHQGIPHRYRVVDPVDIRLINSENQVFYSPSETDIDINNLSTPQVFPAGYLIKTTWDGFPSEADAQAVQNPRYLHPYDLPVPNSVHTGSLRGIYNVKNNSKLVIESCVELVDIDIIVEAGGHLEIEPNVDLTHATVVNNGTIIYETGTLTGEGNIQNNGTHTPNSTWPERKACLKDCYVNTALFDIDPLILPGSYTPYIIGTNTTWDASTFGSSTIRIGQQVFVQPGVTLTIDPGMTLEFSQSGGIVVRKNGHLKAEGTSSQPIVMQAMCDRMWLGIRLEPDWLNQTQSAVGGVNHGKATLKYVEMVDAIIGVKVDGNSIADIRNSDFINCQTGVKMEMGIPYVAQHNFYLHNLTRIQDCSFKTSARLRDPAYAPSVFDMPDINHIHLQTSHYPKIYNCTFENSATSIYAPHDRGTGIKIESSTLKLTGGANANTFTNLSDGIFSSLPAIFSRGIVDVRGQTFTNNIRAVTMVKNNFSIVATNEITVPKSEDHVYPELEGAESDIYEQYNYPTGIMSIESKNFRYEENTITGVTTGSATNPNYGMVIRNTSGTYVSVESGQYQPNNGAGIAYGNVISDLTVAIKSEGDNRGHSWSVYSQGQTIAQPSGLRISCNDFEDNEEDIYVKANVKQGLFGLIQEASMLRDQGACLTNGSSPDLLSPAGNRFLTSLNCLLNSSTDPIEIHAEPTSGIGTSNYPYLSDEFAYNHHIGVEYEPTCVNVTTMVDVNACSFSTPTHAQACPQHFNNIIFGSSTYGDIRLAIRDIEGRIAVVQGQFDSNLDGRNTAGLLAIIQDGLDPSDFTQLAGYAPYLSNQVLIALLEQYDPSVESDILLVLQDNAPIAYEDFWNYFGQNSESFTPDFIADVEGLNRGRGTVKSWVDEMNALRFKRLLVENELYRLALDKDQLDSIVNDLDTTNMPAAHQRKAWYYFQANDYLKAHSEMAHLEGAGYDVFLEDMDILLDLNSRADSELVDLTDEFSVLQARLVSDPTRNFFAKAILELYHGSAYDTRPLEEPVAGPKKQESSTHVEDIAETGQSIYWAKSIPNPSSGQVTIHFHLPESSGEVRLHITDINGRTLQHYSIHADSEQLTIEPGDLSPGIYFYHFVADGQILLTEKLIRH